MVDRIQLHLESIYGITCEARVEAFVVDTDVALQLGATGRNEEELLVSQASNEHTLELALYLSPSLRKRLAHYESQPLEALLAQELNGYCQLAEGVSHFLYVAHSAREGRNVSLLELEGQAEVDKFAICLLHRWGEGAEAWTAELMGRLFDQVSYREELSHAERWRYEEANRLSRNFCKRLTGHVRARRLEPLLRELRYAYRLGAEAKLRHWSQTA